MYPGIVPHTRAMLRDKFQDRVTGDLVWFPGALMLHTIRNGWAYHPNKWAVPHVHPDWVYAYPSLDHRHPQAKGGTHDPDNLITLTYHNQLRKNDRTLQEMGWTLREPVDGWDGGLAWFMAEVAADPTLLKHSYLRKWHNAALRAAQ